MVDTQNKLISGREIQSSRSFKSFILKNQASVQMLKSNFKTEVTKPSPKEQVSSLSVQEIWRWINRLQSKYKM